MYQQDFFKMFSSGFIDQLITSLAILPFIAGFYI